MNAIGTREKIIELGRNLMQDIGYHSFNYKQIANELGIKNASIHHYFPSKEDLAIAVIEKDRADFTTIMTRLESLSPGQKAEAFLEHYGNFFKDGKKLCVIGTFGFAYNDVSDRIQKAINAYVEIVNQSLTDIFKAGIKAKEFSFNRSAAELAADWTAALPGSLALGRMLGAAYFKQVTDSLRKSLNE